MAFHTMHRFEVADHKAEMNFLREDERPKIPCILCDNDEVVPNAAFKDGMVGFTAAAEQQRMLADLGWKKWSGVRERIWLNS